MSPLKLGKFSLTITNNEIYVIAEIGQNHQGNLDVAKEMISEAKNAGCNCVKFQKSNLTEKFARSALNRIYDGVHSWGKTYGEHKNFLEFDLPQYKQLIKYCNQIDIDFAASAMDEVSLMELDQLDIAFIKIGSGDANNFPLIAKAAQLKRPLVISTGMQHMSTIRHIVKIMQTAGKRNFALLHCVSSYPTNIENCRLRTIKLFLNEFPNIVIGYSGHELGIDVATAAVCFGAKIIEKHYTLNKQQKGTDHCCSLEPKEMKQLVTNILNIKTEVNPICFDENLTSLEKVVGNVDDVLPAFLPVDIKYLQTCELKCRLKLGKSLVAARFLNAGQILCEFDIKIKVCDPPGIWAEDYYAVVGKILNKDIAQDSPIWWKHIKL